LRVAAPPSVAFALCLFGGARAASAQPSLHAAAGTGIGYTPIESLSTFDTPELSPAFAQLEVGGTLGAMGSIAHAGRLAATLGFTEGAQVGILASYLLWRRSSLRFAQYARLGLPLVFYPEPTYGVEVGGGGAYFFTAGLGAYVELDVDYFRGIENEVVLGAHLGAIVSYEILPSS
jgi:hypothetical protein